MPLITPPIKNIKEVIEPLKEEILNGNVHTIDEMNAWHKYEFEPTGKKLGLKYFVDTF